MKRFIPLLLIATVMFSCLEGNDPAPAQNADCATLATIRDYRGLDGCGFLLELEDGSMLEPVVLGFCGTPPMPDPMPINPFAEVEFVEGKHVMINYEVMENMGSICMAGTMVQITCIKELTPSETTDN